MLMTLSLIAYRTIFHLNLVIVFIYIKCNKKAVENIMIQMTIISQLYCFKVRNRWDNSNMEWTCDNCIKVPLENCIKVPFL